MLDILVQVLKVIFVLVALIMTFFILLQEGKGGGLAGLGGTKAAGVEGVTNPIRRATAVLSIIFFLLAVLLGILARPSGTSSRDKKLYDTETPTTALAPDAEKKPVQPEAPQANVPEAKKTDDAAKADVKPDDTKAEPAKTDEKPAEKKDGEAEAKKDAPATEKPAEAKADEKAKAEPAPKPAEEKPAPAAEKKAE